MDGNGPPMIAMRATKLVAPLTPHLGGGTRAQNHRASPARPASDSEQYLAARGAASGVGYGPERSDGP
jgi:hypothetical protein